MDRPWCDYGDMHQDECEHCRTGVKTAGTNTGGFGVSGTGRVPATDVGLSGVVPAVYEGICPACGEKIKKDRDWIVRTARGWVHEGCGSE